MIYIEVGLDCSPSVFLELKGKKLPGSVWTKILPKM